jgi:hypothetical protein
MKRFLTTTNDYAPSGVLPLSDTCTHRTLAASTAEEFLVPSGAKLVVMTSLGANSYARGSVGSPNEVAVVPSGDSAVGTSGIPLPDSLPRMFRCDDLVAISVISAGTPLVIAEWLK